MFLKIKEIIDVLLLIKKIFVFLHLKHFLPFIAIGGYLYYSDYIEPKIKEDKKYIAENVIRASYRLLSKCNGLSEGQNCFLSFSQQFILDSENANYKITEMLTTIGKINDKGEYKEYHLSSYYKKNDPLENKFYTLSNREVRNIKDNGICQKIYVPDLPSNHFFQRILKRQNISSGHVSFCYGKCTITLLQKRSHTTQRCNDPSCKDELMDFYYRYIYGHNNCRFKISIEYDES